MKKNIVHNEKAFTLYLRFNIEVEKRIGGKRTHSLTANEINGAWFKVWLIDNEKMKEQIELAEKEIKEYAEEKDLTPEEIIAIELGFN